MPNLTTTALEYAGEGFSVLPLKENKHPNLPIGHNNLYEIMPDDEIELKFNSTAKIGIACGCVSGGFECIDFDAHKGEPIVPIFNKFMEHPDVKSIVVNNRLPVLQTPSGGFHIYYKNSYKYARGRMLAAWQDGTVMVEVRGHGQYVCTLPSDGYKQLSGSEIVKVAEISIEEVDVLYSVAEKLTQCNVVKTSDKTSGEWPTKFTDTVWGKYSEEEVDHAKQLLVDTGWRFNYARRTDGVEYWRRPGKDEGWSATFGSMHNMFYVFTESAAPFKANTAYSPFDVLNLIQFKGNKSEATEWLNERYGVKPPPDKYELEEDPGVFNPVFPVEVFSPTIQQLITQLNKALNYSTDYLSVAIMSTFATVNGNKYKLRVKNGWDAPTIFWFSIVGEPGTMKTHPVKTIFKPLVKIDIANKAAYDLEMVEYNKIDIKQRANETKPGFKQTIVSDSTLEALHVVHSINKRGICFYKDELVGFLNDMNRYRKGSDEQFWLESFNNGSYIVNRVTKEPLLIQDTHINIIGTIQPDILNGIISAHGANGLTDRFLYTSNETNIYPISFDDIDFMWLKKWEDIVYSLPGTFKFSENQDTEYLKFTPEAMGIFMKMDSQICEVQRSDNVSFQMKNYLNKMKTYAPRFALLMNIMDLQAYGEMSDITDGQMIRAVKIIEYFIQSANFIFNNVEKETEISEVSKKLDGKTKTEKIIELHKKGFKQVAISKKLKTPASFVSKIIKSLK
jgi:hypothetical protein